MSADGRLRVDLEVLRLCFAAYLERLRAAWQLDGQAAGAEVERIVASVGVRPEPGRAALAEVRSLLATKPETGDRLAELTSALGLSPGEELLVAAAWWAEADPQFAIVLGCAHDDGARRYPSAALLRLVLEPFGVDAPPALDESGTLVASGVLEAGSGATEPLRPTGATRLLLAGGLPAPLEPDRPSPARLGRAVAALARHLGSDGGGVVLLRGPSGVGRRALAAEAAAKAGRIPVGPEWSPAELRLLARLGLAVPVIPAEEAAELVWRPDDGPLVAWGPPGQQLPGSYVVDLPPPTHAERAALWRERLGSPAAADELAPALAARFAFTEGDVDAVLARADLDAAWREREVDDALVWEAARRQPEHALERLAALVMPVFSLDDLVLAEETEVKLRELVAHVALQHVVLDEWGFRRRLPRGQGVAALFTGPPGTGKTTAAEAIARELGQDLYRIDLSAVVSKYVGETEKNLASAFDEAERGSAVLLFDEADALFGKRTEIRDAHDRYANLEVNYLLQRVETFTGLVVLASNRQSALDEAFLRRLRFVIRFDPPDARLRRELWQRSFPAEARLGELDWDALATAELAGGSIQAAALSAAYLAATDGGVIGEEHVELALLREHQKLGKAWPGIPSRAGV